MLIGRRSFEKDYILDSIAHLLDRFNRFVATIWVFTFEHMARVSCTDADFGSIVDYGMEANL
jgi:hypothetical protein